MESHCHNLNIHYSAPQKIWEQLAQMYAEMPYWNESGSYPNGMEKEMENSLKFLLSPADCNFMLNYPKRNGMTGFHYLRARLQKF